jgi:plastocyanin
VLCVGIGLAALTQTAATQPPAPASHAAQVAQVADTPRPAPTATRFPLPTAPPQMIISRVARETPLPRPTPTPPAEPQVAVVDNGYIPAQMEITLGANVVWVNSGGDGHDVTGTGPGGSWRSGPLAPKDRYSRPFALPGTYDYACTVHPEMRGRVIVVQP